MEASSGAKAKESRATYKLYAGDDGRGVVDRIVVELREGLKHTPPDIGIAEPRASAHEAAIDRANPS